MPQLIVNRFVGSAGVVEPHIGYNSQRRANPEHTRVACTLGGTCFQVQPETARESRYRHRRCQVLPVDVVPGRHPQQRAEPRFPPEIKARERVPESRQADRATTGFVLLVGFLDAFHQRIQCG